jgi:hypothetical protein
MKGNKFEITTNVVSPGAAQTVIKALTSLYNALESMDEWTDDPSFIEAELTINNKKFQLIFKPRKK